MESPPENVVEPAPGDPTALDQDPPAVLVPVTVDRPLSDIFICCFYIILFLAVGVPMWWKNTTVTRVSLPYDEIEAFTTYAPQRRRSLLEQPTRKDMQAVLDPAERWKTFWTLPPTTAIDLVFTLVNSGPVVQTVKWDVESGLRKYLDPSISHLGAIANFSISSQILRYMDEDIVTSLDATGKAHLVSLREASKIINHIESRLGTFSSNDHVLNFIIYIPPPQLHPLKLSGSDGTIVPTNSFITPRWGGVLIYSPENVTPSGSASVTVDMQRVVETFLTQIYVHLGLFDADQTEGQVDLTKDLPSLLHKRAQLNIDDSISTLKSLSSLLGQMGSIAINDVVGQHIIQAVHYIHDAKQHFDAGRYLPALAASRKAWENSERAFYDPSLLEQLYFPDDQKFAIYVPLFLPVGLPVIMSAVGVINWWKARKLQKQALAVKKV